MFQLGTNWQLWDFSKDFGPLISGIKLRGYLREEPVLLPAEFASLKPLSVDDITSIHCPTRRDLFLLRKRRLKGYPTWGRIAGPLIEKFCAGLVDEYQHLFDGKQSYDSVKSLVGDYAKRFMAANERPLKTLGRYSTSKSEDVARLMLVLQYTGRYELAMLGADFILDAGASSQSPMLTRVPILHKGIEILPDAKVVGISSPSTPDFLMTQLQVVGDIKSGSAFKDFYPLSCAGYAIAYESHHGPGSDMNFGIIYFLETHTRSLTTARSYGFIIDDELRQEFLDRRNEAFGVLLRSNDDLPPLANREQYCVFCKYLRDCYNTQ